MNERKAVKYHDRLVAALREGGICENPKPIDGRCYKCGLRSCAEAQALLAEIEADKP